MNDEYGEGNDGSAGERMRSGVARCGRHVVRDDKTNQGVSPDSAPTTIATTNPVTTSSASGHESLHDSPDNGVLGNVITVTKGTRTAILSQTAPGVFFWCVRVLCCKQ